MKLLGLLFVVFMFYSSVQADIYVSPLYFNFGSVKVGSFGFRQSITVSNRSKEATYVTTSGGCFGDFQVSNYCNGVLYGYASCSMYVEFRPQSTGYRSCSLYIREDNGFGNSVQISGSGY